MHSPLPFRFCHAGAAVLLCCHRCARPEVRQLAAAGLVDGLSDDTILGIS